MAQSYIQPQKPRPFLPLHSQSTSESCPIHSLNVPRPFHGTLPWSRHHQFPGQPYFSQSGRLCQLLLYGGVRGPFYFFKQSYWKRLCILNM